MAGLNRRAVHTVVDATRRRLRWLVQPPRVRGALPRMFPGGGRLAEEEEDAAVAALRAVLRSRKLFRFYGPSRNPLQPSTVADLERSCAQLLGVPHALAVNSGTSALVCALVGLGVGPGDEVIVPAYTWVSTASAVLAVGAVPVIAEVDDSLTLDPGDAVRRLSPHTRALIAVHMRGAPARLDLLQELARAHRLALLEDAAQAFGASFGGRRLGSIGDAGAHSFQMSKILTAGEGGLVTTADPAVHRRAAMYHDSAACPHQGVPMEEWLPGLNLRMSELHAAVLHVQLTRLERILADMRAHKRRLKEMIRDGLTDRGVRFRTVHDADGDASIALVFFAPDAARAAALVAALADENVPASRLYHDLAYLPHDHVDLHAYTSWAPILAQRFFARGGEPWRSHPRRIDYASDMCPTSIDLLRRAVHVDISPDLSAAQVEQMGAAILAAAARLL
jgi:dTDP-4-amino-4,6-dideoxygalactose transaminase